MGQASPPAGCRTIPVRVSIGPAPQSGQSPATSGHIRLFPAIKKLNLNVRVLWQWILVVAGDMGDSVGHEPCMACACLGGGLLAVFWVMTILLCREILSPVRRVLTP